MGLFNRKNKVYSLEKALELLKEDAYKNYTTIPVGDKFKLVPEQDRKYQDKFYKIEMEAKNSTNKREEFLKRQRDNVHIDYSKINTEYGQGYWQNNNYKGKNRNTEIYR